MPDIANMTKDELNAFVQHHFPGVKLNLRDKVEALRAQVQEMVDSQPEPAADVPAAPAAADPQGDGAGSEPQKFLKNKDTGRVFEYTDLLAAMDFMVPCDADGNPV